MATEHITLGMPEAELQPEQVGPGGSSRWAREVRGGIELAMPPEDASRRMRDTHTASQVTLTEYVDPDGSYEDNETLRRERDAHRAANEVLKADIHELEAQRAALVDFLLKHDGHLYVTGPDGVKQLMFGDPATAQDQAAVKAATRGGTKRKPAVRKGL